jgi:hypothetical protein
VDISRQMRRGEGTVKRHGGHFSTDASRQRHTGKAVAAWIMSP